MLAILFGYLGFASTTFGNPSSIPSRSNCQTSSATTSASYMTAGNATTTLVCDAYGLDSRIVENTAIDSAVLLMLFNASSSPTFNIALEYSIGIDGINCVSTHNACDWYENNLDTNFASTTAPFSLATVNTISYKFASSTPGGQSSSNAPLIALTNSSRVDKVITIPTPTRYIRMVFTLTGSGNSSKGSVWVELIPLKETN